MPALAPRSAHADDSALLHVLEAYIETLKAENEILKRRLATEATSARSRVGARRSDQVLGAVAGAVL